MRFHKKTVEVQRTVAVRRVNAKKLKMLLQGFLLLAKIMVVNIFELSIINECRYCSQIATALKWKYWYDQGATGTIPGRAKVNST